MKIETTGYLSERYIEKDPSYFRHARRDYVSALADNPRAAVLELGCGSGATGALALAEGKCATYVGIEMFEPMGLEAQRVLSAVHIGNVESMELPYDSGTFDALICSEVIEHLTDPAAVLRRLVTLLKPGGRVYASAPNVAHWRILLRLLRGRFTYEDEGPMDRTHLRWFTPKSFRVLFEECGVKVETLAPLQPSYRWVPWVFNGPFGHLLWYQVDLRGYRIV